MLAAVSSWFRTRRSRYLLLFLCSPILVPLLCVSFPFLCAADLCHRLCRRRRKMAGGSQEEEEQLRRCEEGCCGSRDEVGLLQRYLEDQLMLVGSAYDCGDGEDLEGDLGVDFVANHAADNDDIRINLLS